MISEKTMKFVNVLLAVCGLSVMATDVRVRADSICCGTPRCPWELARLAARRAGVHLYTDTDCVFYTDGMNMVLHGTKDGVVTLSLPRKAVVYDVLTGKAVTAEAVDELQMPLKFAETRILRY